MSSYLPCGVTDSMCEPDDPACASCGCLYSNHYYKDGEEYADDGCSRNSEAELFADGEVCHACDSNLGTVDNVIQCSCEGYVEGEYEPDYEREYDD